MLERFVLPTALLLVLAAASAAQTPVFVFHGDFGGLLDDPTDPDYGVSVAGVGDVDGDGTVDLLVGSSDAEHFVGGAAYVFSGATLEPILLLAPEPAVAPLPGPAFFGHSVAAAGDVDGDGTPDLIVGDYGGGQTGVARVYSGADGALVFERHGDFQDRLGFSVAGIGDVNGDGRDEVVVGAPRDDDAGNSAGAVFVLSGLDFSELFAFTGDAAFDHFGHAVAAAGDVDGDGVGDVVVGVPDADPNGLLSGRSRVYSGADGSVLHTFDGAAAGDRLGSAVAGAGDVDGDGFDDVVLGVPFHDTGGVDAGRVVVRSGFDGSLLFAFDGAASEELGASVAGAGDVDGDGRGDVLVTSAFGNGYARIYSGFDGSVLADVAGDTPWAFVSGGSAGDVDGDGKLDVIVGGGGVRVLTGDGGAEVADLDLGLAGEWRGDGFGDAVAGAGDLDRDGYADVVVGTDGDDPNGIASGNVRVFSGRTGALLFDLDGDAPNDRLGAAVASAGDVDGDGTSDFIAGAPQSQVSGSGYARIFSGADESVIHELSGDGSSSSESFGDAVAGLGDVDGDGFDDVIVGATFHVNANGSSGMARVFSGFDGATLYTFYGDAPGDRLGESVSGAGDVDADGVPDFMVAAPRSANSVGYVRVYSGDDGALLHELSDTGRFGVSLGGIGDLDADGFDDLLVGRTGEFTEVGEVRAYSGFDASLLYSVSGEGTQSGFAISLDAAGDVDGDGVSDFVVGESGDGLGDAFPARVKLFSGTDGALLFTLGGDVVDRAFGFSVAGAGDVNGDGVPDLLVGVPRDDELAPYPFPFPGHDRGSARVYSGAELPLWADRHELSLAAGGVDALSLDAGPAHAGDVYWMFMSGSGTSPGIDFGAGVVLPLNFDPLFQLTLSKPFAGIFSQFLGFLGPDGTAAAALQIPGGANPDLAGVTIHLAFTASATFGTVELASNAVPLTFRP